MYTILFIIVLLVALFIATRFKDSTDPFRDYSKD